MSLRLVSLAVRVLAIGVVAASPWLRPVTRPSTEQSVMYVVDASESMGKEGVAEANEFLEAAWAAHEKEKLGVVAFGARPAILAVPGAARAPEVLPAKDGNASDLASAIRLAVATLPLEGHRSIVLLGDLRPTRGDAEAEVRKASEAGIRVDVLPISGPSPTAPLVTALRARSGHVAEHQPIAFDVEVRSSVAFVVSWTRDGIPMPPHRHYPPYRRFDEDSPPSNDVYTVELVDRDPPPGVHVYEARADETSYGWHGAKRADAGDKKVSPSLLTAVSVEGKAYAAVFSASGDVPPVLADALQAAGLEARRLPLDRAADPASYSGADLVVLADVRVTAAATDDSGLTRAAQTALVDYVQQGGGLLTTGGVFGLAPEYAGTPIARAIPVEIEDRGHVEDPPVALAIMLDRSGSMSAQVGSHTKLELALEASLGAAEVLRPTDLVALASVDTKTHWDVPLGPQERLPQYRDAVRAVSPGGGGIYVYTALKDAYAALKDAKTPIRHVILFSDTDDSEQQVEDCDTGDWNGPTNCANKGQTAEKLAKDARGRGITTTVVGIGAEAGNDTPFLRRLAASAGGRFYITEEGADLRRIFLSETRVLAQSNLREKKVEVAAAGSHPALEGVDAAKLPTLEAYVETGRRSGADTALLLPDGRPLLATWRYGLGKSGAIATDLNEGWGGEWAKSPVAAQLLRQSLRFLLRQSDARRADASVNVRDRLVEVDVELPPDAAPGSAPAAMDVYAVEKSGESHKIDVRLEQRGPGHWRAIGRTEGEAVVIARARDARGALMAEALGREDRTPEVTGEGANTYLANTLARAGEGRVDPTPAATLARTARPAKALVATWPYALVVAAALIVVDLVLRRISERTKGAKTGKPQRIEELARELRAAA
ncbi:MAG: VWA domain-containing protein [Labilithrix sp.]|nr:VWA domain-containing protein [Labilithrix sp.]MCW5817693.1 VWA domain-containing protein [Labilithrix sp.]